MCVLTHILSFLLSIRKLNIFMIYKSITEWASCAAKLAYTSILVMELGLRDIKEINFSLTRFHFLL